MSSDGFGMVKFIWIADQWKVSFSIVPGYFTYVFLVSLRDVRWEGWQSLLAQRTRLPKVRLYSFQPVVIKIWYCKTNFKSLQKRWRPFIEYIFRIFTNLSITEIVVKSYFRIWAIKFHIDETKNFVPKKTLILFLWGCDFPVWLYTCFVWRRDNKLILNEMMHFF